MTNILFVCGKARMRSPTAADVAAKLHDVEADFAGLSNDADERISSEQIEWADIIAVMEKRHLARLRRQFGPLIRGRRVVCLDVPDQFEFMQPELIEILTRKIGPVLTKAASRKIASPD